MSLIDKSARMKLLERKRSHIGILKRKTSSLSLRRKASRVSMRRRRASKRTSSSRSLNSYVERIPKVTGVSRRVVCLDDENEKFIGITGVNLGVDRRRVCVRFFPLYNTREECERGTTASVLPPQTLRPIDCHNHHLKVALPIYDQAVQCLVSVSRDSGQSFHPSDLEDIKYIPQRLRPDVFIVTMYNRRNLRVTRVAPLIASYAGENEMTIHGNGFVDTGNIHVLVSDGNTNIFFLKGKFINSGAIAFTSPPLRQEEPTVATVEVSLDGRVYTSDKTLMIFNQVYFVQCFCCFRILRFFALLQAAAVAAAAINE